jgi:hypothetical protein
MIRIDQQGKFTISDYLRDMPGVVEWKSHELIENTDHPRNEFTLVYKTNRLVSPKLNQAEGHRHFTNCIHEGNTWFRI